MYGSTPQSLTGLRWRSMGRPVESMMHELTAARRAHAAPAGSNQMGSV